MRSVRRAGGFVLVAHSYKAQIDLAAPSDLAIGWKRRSGKREEQFLRPGVKVRYRKAPGLRRGAVSHTLACHPLAHCTSVVWAFSGQVGFLGVAQTGHNRHWRRLSSACFARPAQALFTYLSLFVFGRLKSNGSDERSNWYSA